MVCAKNRPNQEYYRITKTKLRYKREMILIPKEYSLDKDVYKQKEFVSIIEEQNFCFYFKTLVDHNIYVLPEYLKATKYQASKGIRQ